MVKLTEEMIVARTRVSDMSNVKKLNCWGAELTDVSVLRKLINVEVLSLSVNCIITLADIQNCKNLQELYIRKNKIPDLNEVCWLRDLTKLKNLWLEENPCCNSSQSDLYRSTVIRNLPQLQKLDNVVVQPDEVSEAMRRGIELIHPYDQDESIPYTNYAPPGTQTYQQQPIATQQHHVQSVSARRSSQIVEQNSTYNQDDRRNSQYEQYSCPSRRVSNQVFDPPFGHHQDTQPTQPTHHEVAHPPSSSDAQSGYGVRGGSVNYGGMDDGYVPDYHTGRRISATQYQQQQYEQSQPPEQSGGVVTRRSSKVSQHSVSMDSGMRRMSIHEGGSNYEDERNANSYNTASAATSRTNSVAAQQEMAPPAYHSSHQQELLPRNAYARSNSEPTKLKRSPTNTKKISKNTASSNSSNSSSLSKSSPPPIIKEHPTGASEDEGTVTSASSEVALPPSVCRNCSSRSQELSEDDTNGTGHHHSQHHPLNFRSLQGLENGKQKAQLSPTNSNSDHSSTTTSNKKCMNCNGGTSSPSTASTTSTGKMSIEDSGDPRTIVAAHYEQTYEQVDQQIASAKQLLEERRMRTQVSPERPYPRRPKNRNSNILSAVLCLIKELDAPSLEVAEMAIRCRMEELDD